MTVLCLTVQEKVASPLLEKSTFPPHVHFQNVLSTPSVLHSFFRISPVFYFICYSFRFIMQNKKNTVNKRKCFKRFFGNNVCFLTIILFLFFLKKQIFLSDYKKLTYGFLGSFAFICRLFCYCLYLQFKIQLFTFILKISF